VRRSSPRFNPTNQRTQPGEKKIKEQPHKNQEQKSSQRFDQINQTRTRAGAKIVRKEFKEKQKK
jgi:hypothetical protein